MKIFHSLLLFLILPGAAMSQSWQAMQDVPEEMTFPVVVSLRGNIHVLGGGANGGATNLHLRYTPSTNTWDTLAPVPYLAQQPAGAVVNEKIHFCGGGYPNTGTRLDKHYYYDPDSNQWYQAALMPVATAIHKAVGFDGKLYCLSGQPDKTLCEYYDPATDSWTQKNPLPDMDFWYGAIVATSDAIYRFGGGAYFNPSAHAHRYDNLTDTWTSLPDIPLALHALAGINTGDSLVFLSGGYSNGFSVDNFWKYNIISQQYTVLDPLPISRTYHSMAFPDSCIYSIGGNNQLAPAVGVSLLRNCSSIITSSQTVLQEQKPYTMVMNTGQFRIKWNEYMNSRQFSMKLIDAGGRTISEQTHQACGGDFILDRKSLVPGLYLVILNVDGKNYIEKWRLI